jgi:SAM-dependent methyltransferase
MQPPLEMAAGAGFAAVYDAIYDGPAAFYAAQLAFLIDRLGPPPTCILDAGCGTGRHVLALAERGYRVLGLDASADMLRVAQAKLAQAGPRASLAQADLRALPSGPAFTAILCLESPLAYLLSDDDLAAALAGFRRSLGHGGRLIIDVFDYATTLGPDGAGPQKTIFHAAGQKTAVTESHRSDPESGTWHMRQEFEVRRGREAQRFMVEHVLSLRRADDYAFALEEADFVIEELLEGYPASPPEMVREQRMIFVARAA